MAAVGRQRPRRRARRPARRPARSRATGATAVAPTARTIASAVDVEDVGGVDDEVRAAAQAGLGEGGVDGAGREDRRDRQPVERRAAVVEDDDSSVRPRAAATAPAGEPVEGGRRGRRRPSAGGPRRVEPDAIAAAPERARARPSRSATNGRSRRDASAAPRGGPPSSGGRRPSSTRRSMTARSRSGSIGGLVTWANAWRRWSATGRSSAAAAGRRRVVAHAPERLVALERHRPDVEAGALGVEAGEVAQRRRGRRPRPCGQRRSARPASGGRRGPVAWRVVDRQRAPRAARLRLGVLEDRAARPGRRGAARRARGGRAGPSRPAASGTAPASDATATSRSRGHREGGGPQAVAVDAARRPAGRR